MKKETRLLGILTLSAFVLSGCLVSTRTYPLTKERVDQNLSSGNRGYLMGQPPAEETGKPRKATRVMQVVEMEFGSREENKTPAKAPVEQVASYEPQASGEFYQEDEPQDEAPVSQDYRKYKVQKNDTLQKISEKFYGTTRKWMKIYEANRDVLKGPNKIYPGQVINIPEEGMMLKESEENLK